MKEVLGMMEVAVATYSLYMCHKTDNQIDNLFFLFSGLTCLAVGINFLGL